MKSPTQTWCLSSALLRAEAEMLIEEAGRVEADNTSMATPEPRHGEASGGVFRATGYAEGERYRNAAQR